MVRVVTLFVNRASEPFESIGEVAREPCRHVRSSERGDDFEPGGLQDRDPVDPEQRKPHQRTGTQVGAPYSASS